MNGRRFGFGFVLGAFLGVAAAQQAPAATTNSFVNFETAPVHPVALSPDGLRLVVCNLPDNRLEVFDVTSGAGVDRERRGVDLVSVRFRTATNSVVNHLRLVSVVDLATLRGWPSTPRMHRRTWSSPASRSGPSCRVRGQTPSGFRSTDTRAQPPLHRRTANRSARRKPRRKKVYAAIFESGNGLHILAPVRPRAAHRQRRFPRRPARGEPAAEPRHEHLPPSTRKCRPASAAPDREERCLVDG